MTESLTVRTPSLALTLRSLLRADLTVLARSRQTFVFNLAVPVVIIALTSRGNLGRGAGFVVGLALTFGLLSSALMGYATTVARDREIGVFEGLRVTPTPTWTIVVSRLAVQLLACLASSVIVLLVGSIVLRVQFSPVEYLLMLAVALFGGALFLSIGQAIASLVQSATAVNAVSRVMYATLLLIGLLGLTGALGEGFQHFADWTPVGAVINLFATALSLTPWTDVDTYALIAICGYTAGCVFVGTRWFRWTAE